VAELFADFIEIDGAAGAAALGAAAGLAAEAAVYQPDQVAGRQNKNQENKQLLDHGIPKIKVLNDSNIEPLPG
jgi:hypothetical protein